MSQTQFRRAYRDPNLRRPSIVYGFNILDPATMQIRVDYVGKSVRKLETREREHRGPDFDVEVGEQPWSDLIVGKPFIVEQGLWTDAELDERETFHIHQLRPRYNHDKNLHNPERIPIPVARRQREERDLAKGLPSPTWPAARQATASTKVGGAPQRKAAVSRRRDQVTGTPFEGWLTCLLILGPVMTIAGWLALRTRFGLSGWHALEWSAAGTVVVFAVAPLAWWLFKHSRKKTQRKVIGWSVAGLALGLLWLFWPLIGRQVPSLPLPAPTHPAAVTRR